MRIEGGRSNALSPHAARQLAKALQVTPEEIWGGPLPQPNEPAPS